MTERFALRITVSRDKSIPIILASPFFLLCFFLLLNCSSTTAKCEESPCDPSESETLTLTEKNGQHIYEYRSGERFEGEYKNGLREGKGTYFHLNGDRFEGQYASGKRNGKGKYYFSDKSVLEGVWIDNQLEGKAIIRDQQGKIIHQGYWKNNKYIGMKEPDGQDLDRVEILNP